MAFSGLVSAGLTTYLGNTGLSPTTIISLIANNFPVAESRTFGALSANLSFALPALATVTVTVMKNGAPTALTVTFPAGTPAGSPLNVIAPVAYAVNDTFDLRITNVGSVDAATGVSATVSVGP